MNTAITRRLDRVEGDRLAVAITHFTDHCRRCFTAPDAPADAADPEAGEETPFTRALWSVIELTMDRPTNQQSIRAALATVAPFVGLTPNASPLPILAALEDVLGHWERAAQG
jgi:hypothetical protein